MKTGTCDQVPIFIVFGVPYEIRTRVIAVKGRCPRPLDEGDFLNSRCATTSSSPTKKPRRAVCYVFYSCIAAFDATCN